ncbi:Pkinase-domain-containing protein [Lophium mytilinum]|uniref:non-specific serine/threonine protein kinase n=1 Tax=Lophium mytilinum TaxID=390894 RepID=A0A6A6R481_9PEZI|nr:Pkinase-domain-containing protein [Lophium mytilinum]
MDRYRQERPPSRRRPLHDNTLRSNVISTPPRLAKGKENHRSNAQPSSPGNLPHNESLVANGTLAVRHHHDPVAENKRVSAVSNEEHHNKRDSEISNASTNASDYSRRRKTHIGPWQLGKTIGKGGCSRVRVVRHSVTQQYGAAKIISKATAEKVRALSLANLIKSAETEASLWSGGKVIPFGLEREIVIMKLLEHRNIVKLYDVWENHNELYLVMEYVQGGELFHYIEEQGGLQEIEVVHLFRQIIAALLYCHRLHIHHRDLKPENILLDRSTFEIKLVDFGMAALQPEGQKLSTPCGSPHYAAPEVIRFRAYDGGKADVWSCGVILYVMLTGTPPFNYSGDDRDLKDLFRAISLADYVMPDMISKEAQDLIRRILVTDPTRRISIDDIWAHPFLHKYDSQLSFRGENSKKETWIGPSPRVDDWDPLSRRDIDREIFRNMRMLWHSEKEEVLVQKLLNEDNNHEKYFYSALVKHRDEQLEHYVPSPGGIGYSASDYHHNKLAREAAIRRLPPKNHQRSQSQYSILNDEHLYSKHSFYEPPPSDASYDPFRASRDPIVNNKVNYVNVTVLRGSSNGSRKPKGMGERQRSSLRVQTLKNARVGSSGLSSAVSATHRANAAKRRSMSRGSLTSSLWPSSPPVVIAARPSSTVKRGVSFTHLRRTSTVSVLNADLQYTPEQRKFLSRPQEESATLSVSSRSTARPNEASAAHTSRAPTSPKVPRLRIRKPESPSRYIQSEARKVSTELEKVMEEAFNRSSISSSVRTSNTDKNHDPFGFDTPPTSFSNQSGGLFASSTPTDFKNRPLPPIPTETPNTFLQRELAQTRDRLARFASEDENTTASFNEVLNHLDRLLQPDNAKRTSSAPPKSPEYLGYLPIISESRAEEGDEHKRSVTDPLKGRPAWQSRAATDYTSTIRVVNPDSPTAVAPLNIRKKSGASTSTKSSVPSHDANGEKTVRWSGPTSLPRAATPTPPHKGPGDDQDATIRSLSKKRSWFRRVVSDKGAQEHDRGQHDTRLRIPEAWQGLDDRIKNVPAPPIPSAIEPPTKHAKKQSDTSSEFPMREEKKPGKGDGNAGRRGFLGLFGKKHKDDRNSDGYKMGLAADSNSLLESSGYDLASDDGNAYRPDYQTNWLSRFFHIKPASKTLCFHIGRGRARQELVRLLRDWQRFGVRDVFFDRKTNIVNARVDKSNHLKIKPVSLVIELFVVLEHGRRAQLCIARFTQTRGAASSFRKVVDIVEDVFKAKGVLIEDEEKKNAMCEVLG